MIMSYFCGGSNDNVTSYFFKSNGPNTGSRLLLSTLYFSNNILFTQSHRDEHLKSICPEKSGLPIYTLLSTMLQNIFLFGTRGLCSKIEDLIRSVTKQNKMMELEEACMMTRLQFFSEWTLKSSELYRFD